MNVQVSNIQFSYSNSKDPVIKGISFEIESGSVVAIVGESGSGKSTTLRILAGLEQPSSGKITVGKTIYYSKEINLQPEERSLGMVFQDYALFPHLTVGKNVGFALNHLSKKDRQLKITEMLKLVGLEGFDKRYPHELSGGQQQRVALARALAPEPRILLMDEPFSNLDAHLHDKIREELEGIIRRAGITTIFVTHDKKDALKSADHVIVMEEGQINVQGDPKKILINDNQYV